MTSSIKFEIEIPADLTRFRLPDGRAGASEYAVCMNLCPRRTHELRPVRAARFDSTDY